MAIRSRTSTIEIDQYNGKMTSFVILSCMVATMGGVIFGYDVGIIAGVTSADPFLEKFFPSILARIKKMETDEPGDYCMFDSRLLTAFTSSMSIAGMFASLFAAPITQKYGCRRTMMIGGAASLTGAAVGGAAGYVWMLILGRVLLGFGVGFANQAVPLYLSEMALPTHRGAFSVGFRCNRSLGFILASLINFVTPKIAGHHCWRLSLCLAAVPASFLAITAIFLPETPPGLIQQGRLQNAIGTLQRIRGTADVITELNDITSNSSPHEFTTLFGYNSYRMIAQHKYRPQLVTAIAIPFFSQLTGSSLVTFCALILSRRVVQKESGSLLSAVVLGLISLCANIVAAMSVDRLGRRASLIIGGAQIFVSQLMIGIAMAENLDEGYGYSVLGVMCIFVAGFEWSWGPGGWLVPSEIFPLETRSAGQSIAVAVSFLLTVVVSQSLRLLCVFRVSTFFFFFAGWASMMTAFVWFMLPETKNVPMEQMKAVWREHWFWGRMAAEEGALQDP